MPNIQEVSSQELLREIQERVKGNKLKINCGFCRKEINSNIPFICQDGEYYHFQNNCYERNKKVQELLQSTIRY